MRISRGWVNRKIVGPTFQSSLMGMGNLRYFSFLLRLWQEKREGQLIWRASLENPHDKERLGFPDIPALLAFLENMTKENTPRNGHPSGSGG
jgi:hypothetical protein